MYNGKTGYMSSQYLSTTNPIENTKPETQGEVLFPDWFKINSTFVPFWKLLITE